ncbi:hypothetical protein APHAL10511_004132 [Amanita phalloides]|nr:hypothetical protein APHAL10511_004132 [Amanita phalloides]
MSTASNLPPFDTRGLRMTQSPNPSWKFGQKIEATPEGKRWMEGAKNGWKVIDTSVEDKRKLYATLISGIVPRPVAFISTVSATGTENLAPFSWFNQVSSDPPVVAVGCYNLPTGLKDSAQNIRDTKGFTINIISEPWLEQANACSIDCPPNVSEWGISGLTKEPSLSVKAPRVKESAFVMECELLQAIDILDPETKVAKCTMILGTVKYIHIRNDVLDERGYADPAKLKPVSRLGNITYAVIKDALQLPRPTWEKDGEEIMKVLGGTSKTSL